MVILMSKCKSRKVIEVTTPLQDFILKLFDYDDQSHKLHEILKTDPYNVYIHRKLVYLNDKVSRYEESEKHQEIIESLGRITRMIKNK